MRSAQFIGAGVIVALALAGCGSSEKSGSSGSKSTTTVATGPVSVDDFCAKVQGEVEAFDITGISGKSADDLKATYEDLAPRLDALAAQAPAAIQSDFDTFVALEKKIAGVLADADYNPRELSLSSLPELTSSSTLGALQRIGTFFRDQCHFVDNSQ